MSILDYLQCRAVQNRRMDQFSVAQCNMESRSAHAVRNNEFVGVQEEYILSATISIRFWANNAQHSDARQHAEKALVHSMYKDVLAHLHSLRKAISDGDRIAAFTIADHIQHELVGDA